MGRPTLGPHARSEILHVRVTKAEREEIAQQAGKARMSLTDFARQQILASKAPVPPAVAQPAPEPAQPPKAPKRPPEPSAPVRSGRHFHRPIFEGSVFYDKGTPMRARVCADCGEILEPGRAK